MAKAVQKAMEEEFEAMKGRSPAGSVVIVRELANDIWLATTQKE